MKNKIILLCLLSAICPAGAQYRSSATFQPFSFGDMAAPYVMYTNAYNKANAEINALKKYVVDALGKDIDEMLRQQLNDDYNKLKKISDYLNNNGLRGVADAIDDVKNSINDHVVAYNNRLARVQREYELEQQRIEAERKKKAEEAARLAAEPTEWTGSGFAINNKSIVTNYHVVDGAKLIKIRGVKGEFDKEYDAKVVATDVINDIAVLKIEDNTFTGFGQIPYSVRTSMAEVGEDVFVLGYPLTTTMGEEIKLTTGVISSRTGFQGDVSNYQITAPVQPGNSGGPLFDKNGNIIGIVSAKHADAENAGYAVKTAYLKNLLESSSMSNMLPTKNLVAGTPLSSKVKRLKNSVFIVYCSGKTEDSGTQSNPAIRNGVRKYYPSGKNANYPHVGNISNNLTVVRVEMNNMYTMIMFVSKYTGYAWCKINPDSYIIVDGTKYELTKAVGIATAPDITYYYGDGVSFSLYFKPIPDFENVEYIHFQEPNGWHALSIDVRDL